MAQSFMEKRVDPKWIVDKTRFSGMVGGVLWMLGFIFAILGIVADCHQSGTLGLTAMAWFLLAVVLHMASMSYWLCWALGVYLKAKGAKTGE